MEKRRVVITGMGALSPIGNTVKELWQSAKSGSCGIAPITLYDNSEMKAKLAGEVKKFSPEGIIEKQEQRKLDRCTQFALVAAVEAFTQSGLEMDKTDPNRCGVLVSTGIGGLATIESECLKGNTKGWDRVSPYFIPMTIANMSAGHVAIRLGFKGMCSCPVTACASGSNAIGDAMRQIRDGYAEVMVCGGTEASITRFGMGGFTSLKALCTNDDPSRASIPFDKERSGFVMGEGAGMLILEEFKHAEARGAKILGEVVGYGATCDAHHITAPLPGGEGAAQAMVQSMKDAGIAPEQVGYINAHGTSTPLNDAGETKAVKAAFGSHANKLAISSTKSMTGHLLGASGAVEGIITAMAVAEGYIPPTINYRVPDEECDLDIVPNHGRSMPLDYAMSNSLGFGGHNASIIFKRWEEA